jgi:hypothetical protein
MDGKILEDKWWPSQELDVDIILVCEVRGTL